MIHAKKVRPEFFKALQTGSKRFELRREDPEEPRYAVGDYLALNEWAPDSGYTGRCLLFLITWLFRDPEFLSPGCVALSIKLAPLCFDDVAAAQLRD